ncbi:MAG: DUF305 domain-containing protein, partial [bacterium]
MQSPRLPVRALAVMAMCAIADRSAAAQVITPAPAAPAAAATVANRPRRSEADVQFMSGMIPHHAQAVLIAGWAASHGARTDVRILCERIVVGQRDEIALMQFWLM